MADLLRPRPYHRRALRYPALTREHYRALRRANSRGRALGLALRLSAVSLRRYPRDRV